MEALRLLGLPQTAFFEFLLEAAAGVALYFILSGISYLTVFVAFRRRIHPDYVPKPHASGEAMRLAVVGIVGSVAILEPFNMLVARGKTLVYWDSRVHGTGWLVLSVILYFVAIETGIYWIHRGMHWTPLYRTIHRFHHKWRAPTSWVSMAFHPLDSFALALPLHAMIFVVPIHGHLLTAMQLMFSVWSVSVHDRVSIVHWRWFNHTDNHTLHHWYFQCNYGQFTTFWDRAMGTWRDPVEASRTGAVPASIVRRIPEKKPEPVPVRVPVVEN